FHVERWRSVRGGQVFYNATAAAAAGRTRPVRYDYRATLAGLQCPITIIAGDHDFVDMGAVMHRRWAGPLANVHLVVMPNAGHNAWIDAPNEFRRLLIQGLRRSGRYAGCGRHLAEGFEAVVAFLDRLGLESLAIFG